MGRTIRSSLGLLALTLILSCTQGPRIPCPDVRLINGLHIMALDRQGRAIAAEPNSAANGYLAELIGVSGGCAYDDNGVDLNLGLTISVTGVGQSDVEQLNLPYFLVVEDGADNVIGGERLTTSVTAPAVGQQIQIVDELEQRIADPNVGPGYQVLIGLALDQSTALQQWRQMSP